MTPRLAMPLVCPRCGAALTHAYPVDHDPERVGTAFYSCGGSWCHVDGMREQPDKCTMLDTLDDLAHVLRRYAPRFRHNGTVRRVLDRAGALTGRAY